MKGNNEWNGLTDEVYPLISVVIPIYNVEKFLPPCIDSVLSQTYKNIEVLLIDDGSPDGCGQLCDNYMEKDHRIHVIHQENSGVAEARNHGLRAAKGEYLFFLDADDMLAPEALITLYRAAVGHSADIVSGQNITIGEDAKAVPCDEAPGVDSRTMSAREAMRYYATKDWAPWNRLYKREIHQDIWFPHFKIHEDEAIKFLLLERCERVVEVGAVTYGYRNRSTSITKSTTTERIDMFRCCSENYIWLKAKYPDVALRFLDHTIDTILYNIGAIYRNKKYSSKYLDDMHDFLQTIEMDVRKNRCVARAKKLRVRLFLISKIHNPECLYIRFYKLVGKLKKTGGEW